LAQGGDHPVVLVMAGPNGAGKSTSAPLLVRETAGIERYLNADAIARGFSPFQPDLSAIAAGRLMISHMNDLGKARQSFAVETTLAGVKLAGHLSELRASGYRVHLIYLWLPSADVAVRRVQQRVALGGHSIPEAIIRRRYLRSLRNLIQTYLGVADSWHVYDNGGASPALIARGTQGLTPVVENADTWNSIQRASGRDNQ
jgi:predicted ABC-type ATPase